MAILGTDGQDGASSPTSARSTDGASFATDYAYDLAAKRWTMPIRDWKAALNQFVVMYGDRVPQ